MSQQSCVTRLKCIFLLALFFVAAIAVMAQSDRANLSGTVQDTQNAAIADASVKLVNVQTGTESNTKTNKEGAFVLTGLLPGHYSLRIDRDGFATTQLTRILLNVGDNKSLLIKMKIGSRQETVTVDAGGMLLNTTDASVSTVVDRNFLDTMPLNGRSIQTLILLSPGVVTANPQIGSQPGVSGEFSVNGQRSDANNFTVDGLSANNGPSSQGGGAGNSGALPSSTALGTTQSLASVESLQEFRISTSTYSAESGRQPGAQVQLETRSGANQFHGSIFNYFRNDALDANNWFNDNNTPVVRKPAERQNQFGGVLGGPMGIPGLYSGKDRLFFFVSYEGLRLTQPKPLGIMYVPTDGSNPSSEYDDPLAANLRANSPAALQPLLNAFPKPNCTLAQNPQCVDYHDGLSPYLLNVSEPSKLDSISGRADYQALPGMRLFFRYADTTSSAVTSVSTYATKVNGRTRTLALGEDGSFTSSLSNHFRLGYSSTRSVGTNSGVDFDGATPVDLMGLQGLPPGGLANVYFSFPSGDGTDLIQSRTGTPQHQWNLVDSMTWSHGHHVFRYGIDYLRTTAYINTPSLSSVPTEEYLYYSPESVLQNAVDFGLVGVGLEQDPAFTSFGAFIQDEWSIQSRLHLSLGLRWELAPPPSMVGGTQQRTLDGDINNPASLTLGPVGEPLYKTTYANFAPRVGMAATLRGQQGHETILRAGGGVYFDTGQNFNFYGAGNSPGIGGSALYSNSPDTPVAFPFTQSQLTVTLGIDPPFGGLSVVSRDLQLPYTVQWNVSMEQALGRAQSLTVGYVGSNGRRLLSQRSYDLTSPDFTWIVRFENGLSSSYNSMQVKYQRQITHGLQILGAYTWSHGMDYGSQDVEADPYQRGNSDYDVRNNFTAALSYNLPAAYSNRYERAFLGGWGADMLLIKRSAFPVQLLGPQLVDSFGRLYSSLLNYDGSNPYVHAGGIPGRRQYNSAAFSVPELGVFGTSPRNFLRGFGETEVNLAVRRDFPIRDQVHVEFRADSFNLLNHPIFGGVDGDCGSTNPGSVCSNPLMGQAVTTLANSLGGGGGLSSLYQQGGPRSFQLSLKVRF